MKTKALYDRAEPLYQQSLALAEIHCGPDHPAGARDLNNLAQLLKATHRLAEAEPLMRRSLLMSYNGTCFRVDRLTHLTRLDRCMTPRGMTLESGTIAGRRG